MGDSKAKVGLSFMYDCPAGLKDVSFDLIYKLLIKYVEVSKIFFRERNRQITHWAKNNLNISLNGRKMHHVKSI